MAEAIIVWNEDGVARKAHWRSERGVPPPADLKLADDRITADEALRILRAGCSLLWRGDFQNARQLLQAMSRRIERREAKSLAAAASIAEIWAAQRQLQAVRADMLGRLLIPQEADYGISLRRAPDIRAACREAWGEPLADTSLGNVLALRELQGLVGAHEWRRKGLLVPALGARIHPHYGVFSPLRGDYLELVATAPLAQLPGTHRAFDIGTGTGVIAAILLRRGLAALVGTDRDPRALACARENLAKLGAGETATVIDADLFPPGQAPLIVCNPPWLPGIPSAGLEYAIYDPASRMLRGFLDGLAAHLEPAGEGWLILSDLAEHLGLRRRDELLYWIAGAGLEVAGRHDTRPHHARASDRTDPLHAVRAAEVTSLWRLRVKT